MWNNAMCEQRAHAIARLNQVGRQTATEATTTTLNKSRQVEKPMTVVMIV